MKVLQISTVGFADPRFYRSNEFSLCKSLAKLGHEVTLFSSDKHPKWQMLDKRSIERKVESVEGFTLRRYPSGPELGTIPLMPTLPFEIMKTPWDVIHAHTILAPSSFYSALLATAKRKPLVVTQHDYIFGAAHGIKLLVHMFNNNTFGRFTMHAADAVIGLSSDAARFAQKFGAAPQKTAVIPTSVDTTVFRPGQKNLLRDRYGIEGEVVLFVGRLTRDKAPDAILKAFQRVTSVVPDAKLVLVGKGKEEATLRDLQRRLNLENVYFLGMVPRNEMPFIYAGAQVLVLPSVFEIFGNVVLEAMATGLPVVGSKIAGMADVIADGITGFHIRPGDIDQIANYLTQLLTNRDLREHMCQAARSMAVEKFDDISIARAVESIYKRCLKP